MNGYAYARNSPLLFTDPDGRDYRVCDENGKNCADLTDAQYDQWREDFQGYVTPGGRIYSVNDDGSRSYAGTATYFDGDVAREAEAAMRDLQAFMKMVGENALAQVGGRLTLALSSRLYQAARLWRAASQVSEASLEPIASSGGPTVEVVTSQTGAIAPARGLYAGLGAGARDLATSMRADGVIHTAKIPVALIRKLASEGLATVSQHLGGALEVFFKAEAMPYVARFL